METWSLSTDAKLKLPLTITWLTRRIKWKPNEAEVIIKTKSQPEQRGKWPLRQWDHSRQRIDIRPAKIPRGWWTRLRSPSCRKRSGGCSTFWVRLPFLIAAQTKVKYDVSLNFWSHHHMGKYSMEGGKKSYQHLANVVMNSVNSFYFNLHDCQFTWGQLPPIFGWFLACI